MIASRDLAAFQAELLAGPTATEALRRWCAARSPWRGRVKAHRIDLAARAPPDGVAARLSCGPSDAIRYRCVELRWGAAPLSIADNWYVPDRLTPEMNRELQASDTPFGEVVASLGVMRHVLSTAPATESRDAGARRPVLQQDAVLVRADRRLPLAVVSETYLRGLLDIGA